MPTRCGSCSRRPSLLRARCTCARRIEEVTTRTSMAELRTRRLTEGAWVLADPPSPAGTIVAAGSMVGEALRAASDLAEDHGLTCRVVQVFGPNRLAALPWHVRQELIPSRMPTVSLHNSAPSVLGRFLGPRSIALGIRGFGECGKPLMRLWEMHHMNSGDVVRAMVALTAGETEG